MQRPVCRVPQAALLVCAVLAAAGCGGAADDARPDVLLITLDTVRADHLGCYGYDLDTTPRLDALAAGATRFTRCQSTSALTPVSHASMLTGMQPYEHGLRVLHAESGFRLPDSVPTLAERFGAAGWDTAAVLSAFPVSEHFGLERGFAHFDNGMSPELAGQQGPSDRRQAARQRRSDATTDAAIEWAQDTSGAFFLWVHYWDPHDPILTPPEEHLKAFRAAAGERAPDLYDAELHYVDSQIGRLLDALEARGRLERTIVLVTSDHGEGQGEHGWDTHRLLYEEQIHVPLIAHVPGRGAGRVVEQLVSTTDVFAGLLQAAGLEPEGERGLIAAIDGRATEAEPAYAEALIKWDTRAALIRRERPQDDDLLHCLTDGSLKLIFRPLRPTASELYDLASDPEEAHNLYSERPDLAAPLVERLSGLRAFALEPFGGGEIDPDVARALRELGYAGDD